MNVSLRINALVLMVAHKLELENNNAFQISMTQKKILKILENSINFVSQKARKLLSLGKKFEEFDIAHGRVVSVL
jgi:hypothetical protein